ncbi:conserved hypothetical protein [Pyrobaculum islandicum DSM 4184]|uniref:Uncharacterized protein n=1 Tax=Pyrobaculum islandicum (strain DSM 4184 / JCM 9189 / GEO3) TaxID=384616 RepID=A1RV08_PYRIL|nr:hypothetical protein [Pyrobaculum islandicum]ABL88790.1 conserved hypothetical protein [Pyrobaculum islandicum DSM 4184]
MHASSILYVANFRVLIFVFTESLFVLLASILALGAIVEIRDSLGFPVVNATVCYLDYCTLTNSSGVAKVPQGLPIEIYIGDLLVWKTYATGYDLVTIRYIHYLDILPINTSGFIVIKMAKLRNGTYADIKIPYAENKLTHPLPVGNINYPVEVYITDIGGVELPNASIVKRTVWDLSIDLESIGLVARCRISAKPPATRILIYQGNRTLTSGIVNVTVFLTKGATYLGVVETQVILPNGTAYKAKFHPGDYCGRIITINATRLVVRAIDSFGVLRTDWTIYIAGRAFKGQAELWVLPHVVYSVAVDAGFTKKNVTLVASHPSETYIIVVENAYILFNYQQAVDRVYIVGNYTLVAQMPRRAELPPGTYKIYTEVGGRNVTYAITLRPGEIAHLTIGLTKPQTQQEKTPTLYMFIGVVFLMVVIALLVVLKETRRRLPQGRGQSHS